jgi:hypothetical protein
MRSSIFFRIGRYKDKLTRAGVQEFLTKSHRINRDVYLLNRYRRIPDGPAIRLAPNLISAGKTRRK